MGVYRFDKDGIMYLETYHPGTTPEKVKENVSFDLNISRVTGETKRPTYREMFIIREIVDFERIFLPAKLPDFPPHVAKIIEEIEKT
jgi:glutaconate CoA-transferase subunit B